MNIKSALIKTSLELKKAGISSPEIDARILLECSTGFSSTFIFSNPDSPISKEDYATLKNCLRRRKRGEPIAYITGHKEFFGNDFFVNKNVLVPRPETELLVEEAIEYIKKIESSPDNATLSILDIGCGSGNIIISLALAIPTIYYLPSTVYLYGADIDRKAIEVARKNAVNLRAKNVMFYCSDLFSNKRFPKKFNLIVANLPYVPSSTRIQNQESGIKQEISFEPQDAIFADDNGTSIIKRFLAQAKERIDSKGLILTELDPRNAKSLFTEAKKYFKNVELKKDLSGEDRYLVIENN